MHCSTTWLCNARLARDRWHHFLIGRLVLVGQKKPIMTGRKKKLWFTSTVKSCMFLFGHSTFAVIWTSQVFLMTRRHVIWLLAHGYIRLMRLAYVSHMILWLHLVNSKTGEVICQVCFGSHILRNKYVFHTSLPVIARSPNSPETLVVYSYLA